MVRYSADFEDTDDSFYSTTDTMATPTPATNTNFVQALAALSPEAQAIVLATMSNQRPKHKLKDPDPFDNGRYSYIRQRNIRSLTGFNFKSKSLEFIDVCNYLPIGVLASGF
jgi:hypothetical protein